MGQSCVPDRKIPIKKVKREISEENTHKIRKEDIINENRLNL